MTKTDIETFVDDMIAIAHAPGALGSHLAQRVTGNAPGTVGHVGLHAVHDVSEETQAKLARLKEVAAGLSLPDVASVAMTKSGKAAGAFQADQSMVTFFTPKEAEDGFQICLRYISGRGTGIATLSFHQHRKDAA